MTERRGFGDEMWWLARDGKAEALRHAGELLSAHDGELDYEAHRALAFALAVEGRADDALAELNEGWTDEWPFPSAYATDVARVRFLAGEYEDALTALGLAARSAEGGLEEASAELVRLCVARRPSLWRSALRVATAGGSPGRRAQEVLRVLRARLGGG